MRLLVLLLTSFMLLPAGGKAQLQKMLFQTFPTDSVNVIRFEMKPLFLAKTWAGNQILVETEARLYDGKEAVFDVMIQNGRYELEAVLEGDELRIKSSEQLNRELAPDKGMGSEEILVQFYIPDRFEQQTDGSWLRRQNPGFSTSPSEDTSDQ